MTKLCFSLAFLLLTFNVLTSCGNTESTAAEETTETLMEEAQKAVSDADNTLQEKTKSAEVSTYKTAAAMKQAIESLQAEMENEVKSLQADLNGASEEAAQVINKKINFIQDYMAQLAAYQGKSDKINDVEAPDFGKNVAVLINKIRRDMATIKDEK